MSRGDSQFDLIQQAVAGDQASLAQLLLLHYDQLKLHISDRLSPELQAVVRADDILHQTLVRVVQSIRTFEWRHEKSFRVWTRTIADNLVKDARRRRRRERRARSDPGRPHGEGDASSLSGLVDKMAGESTSPSSRVQRRENVRSLRRALDDLPPDQREVLRRHYLEGQSLDEIAVVMHRTKDAVRGICYRGRKSLRALMGRSSLYFSG